MASSTSSSDYLDDMLRVSKFWLTVIVISLVVVLILGCVMGGWHGLSLVLWAIALLVGGAGIGFLFGMPKVVQDGRSADRTPVPQGAQTPPSSIGVSPSATVLQQARQQRVRSNTNLEEISDWLTKIIVGVGLVELRKVIDRTDRLAELVGGCLGDGECPHAVGCAVIILFSVAGFLFGFLLTRLYLQDVFARGEDRIAERIDNLEQRIARRVGAAVAAMPIGPHRLTAAPAEPLTVQGLQQLPMADEQLKATEAIWQTDPFEGYAGGLSEVNQRKLSATISPAAGPDHPACLVQLEVRSTDAAKPLQGEVIFHLHPTFPVSEVKVQIGADGVARHEIYSWGVFTVGADADNGTTKLELNLARVSGGTTAFYAA